MESSKLKNIVLLILIITNLLLGLLMLVQGVTSRQRQTQLLRDAVTLLEDRGIAVDLDAIPQADFSPSMTLERSNDWELEMFSGLLGADTTATQRGLVSYYVGELGQAEAREDGSFVITLTDGAFPLDGQSIRSHGQAALRRMGFESMVTSAEENALEVVQQLNGTPVFSCTATLRYQNSSLTEISGVRLTGVPTAEASQTTPLSIATLLLRFRSGIIDSGDACSAIVEATQGYVLSPGASGRSRLIPVLRLETDTSLYLVDALTGTVSRA